MLLTEYSILYTLYFVLGSIIGSFLNVVILRFGTGRGLGGRSHCGVCNRTLKVLDLVPIVSWLLLLGKCRKCSTKISVQYPFVEFLTALLFVLVAWQYSGVHMVLGWVIVSLGVCIAVYDAMHMRIPVVWNYALVVVSGLFVLTALSVGATVTALVGAGVLGGLFLGTYIVSRGRVLGFGDVILAVSLGLVLGAFDGLLAVWLGCVLGSIFGIYQIALRDKKNASIIGHQIPFGPFLVAGFIIVFLNILTFTTFFDVAFEVL